MTELCQELRNWFDRDMKKWSGDFAVENGELSGFSELLKTGQYFRVIGSVFNDGVHKYGDADLEDEKFTGSVWAMAVPSAAIALSSEIDAWKEKYGGVEGASLSPYSSESFGGYSYTKSYGNTGNGVVTWQSVFRSQLNRWRKI